VKPKNAEEEVAERVEDLNEEVPPKSNVRSEIRNEKLEAVGRREERRKVTDDQ
jgi:hypothetical protein